MVEALNYISIRWWSYFIPLILQNTVFLGVIYWILLTLRKLPLQSRYALALLGLIKLLIPAFLPFRLLSETPISTLNQTYILEPVIVATGTETATVATPPNVTTIIMSIWLLFAVVMLAAPLVTLARTRYRLREAELIDTRNLANGRPVRIYRTNQITLPMTLGIFIKRIYVPILWNDWSHSHRELALRHELAHLQRNDGLISGLQVIAQSLYFFHPLVWLLNRRINELREMVADNVAQGFEKNDSIIYSRFLVTVAENMMQSQLDCPTAHSLLKKKKELLNRVQYLLEDKMETTKRIMGYILPVVLVLAVLLSWNCQGQMTNSKVKADLTEKGYEVPEDVKFIPYDVPPEPIGGFEAIMKNVKYPELAKNAGITGTVVVMAYINETGKVTETKVLKSIPDTGLDEAAAQAIIKTQFRPAQQRDKYVGVWITIPVNFKLKEGEKSGADLSKINNEMEFVPYDTPPEPEHGYNEILHNLQVVLKEKQKEDGTVIIQAFIDENGTVQETKIVKGLDNQKLNDAASKALMMTKFVPAMQGEKPVGVWISIPVNFTLNDKKKTEAEADKSQLELKKLQFEIQRTAQQVDQLKREIAAERIEIEKMESEQMKYAAKKDLEIKLKDLQFYEQNFQLKQAQLEAATNK